MKIFENYMLIKIRNDLRNFERAVNYYLSLGWEIYGDTQIIHQRQTNKGRLRIYDTIFYQALVKLKKSAAV